jgi:hypothetical protein
MLLYNMACKVGIKIGHVEINYEGDEAFFREELPKMILEISHLVKNKETVENLSDDTVISPGVKKIGAKKLDMSVSSIAAKIGQKTGPDLILAAAAYLTFVQKTESFSRNDLSKAMKTAPSLNKKSYVSNFATSLERLVTAQALTQNANGKYALSPSSLTKLGNLLGE